MNEYSISFLLPVYDDKRDIFNFEEPTTIIKEKKHLEICKIPENIFMMKKIIIKSGENGINTLNVIINKSLKIIFLKKRKFPINI